ncbi:major facilitator superfamily domain-containing protein [Calycina marina]|uniref:Major facilitator superfamily domain-containing protein n=1 Tax=Calycina marina TaxID=1763456 RepID=A0A9P7Z547_9HELO|nr:major facilitator superfamily domain-containing protein [Calycina marina]
MPSTKLPSKASISRQSSTLHYQTFPVAPPRWRGSPMSRDSSPNNADQDRKAGESPLPVRQLVVLAIIALAEQTAFNSISPYLPEMTSTFPGVDKSQIGLYVGLIASSFALAQFGTNLFWGWLSDRVGRKPVVMLGTLLTAACFLAFGFCRTLWQAILVQVLMGIVNGNQGIVSTCLGEITDRSNQSKAFTYLPIIYGLGGITGPALGGLLVLEENPFQKGEKNAYPYLLPNMVAALLLLIDLVITGFFLEESLEEAKELPPLKKRVRNLFSYLWQFAGGARHPTYTRRGSRNSRRSNEDIPDGDDENQALLANTDSELSRKDVLKRDTILLLGTYFIFQLSNIAFNTLYPIFGAAPEPTGRNLNPEEIGLSLSFAGIVMIIFQIALFAKIKGKMGNKATYRAGMLLFFFSMMMMPWLGHRTSAPLFDIGNGSIWLWIELGFVLLIKTIAAVGGLTSAMLLITNSAPNHSVLGTLNGLAQTLSAAGRAAGPFLSGGLFSLATRVRPKGEALAWGVFGGIAFVGWILSFGIRGENLESEDWQGEDESGEEDEDEEAGAGR